MKSSYSPERLHETDSAKQIQEKVRSLESDSFTRSTHSPDLTHADLPV